MNICKDNTSKPEVKTLVKGHLYSWKNTPINVNLFCEDACGKPIMVNIETGLMANSNPVTTYNISMYVDVTDQYCLKKID